MRKEIFAAILLTAIFILSLLNIRMMKNLTEKIEKIIDETVEASQNGEWEKAAETTQIAIDTWSKKDSYTHIVMRHSDVDMMTEDFYELLKAIYSESESETSATAKLVKSHLSGIVSIEKIRFGNVF